MNYNHEWMQIKTKFQWIRNSTRAATRGGIGGLTPLGGFKLPYYVANQTKNSLS